MIAKLTRRLTLVFSIAIACASCGSGIEVAGQLLAKGGIGGSGIVFGPVSTTTSSTIVVNGVTWDISAAEITIDGQPVSNPGPQGQDQSTLGISALGSSDPKVAPPKDRLEEGMVVSVEGTIHGDTGVATVVAAEHVINGVVGAVPLIDHANTVIIRGQTVQVDETTLLPDVTALTPGEHVRVSGFVKGRGRIAATRIELAGGELARFRVEGFIYNTSIIHETFWIGNHPVHWRGADISGLDGDPEDGLLVEVEERNPDVIGPFVLDIDLEGLGRDDADQVKLAGFVSQVIPSNNIFVLGNQPVQTGASTLFAGGLANDIVVGTKLEVAGVLVNGLLVATQVSFSNPIVLESDVKSFDPIDPIRREITLMQLPGITVTTNGLTTFTGMSINDELTPNDHVQIRGHVNGGMLIATAVTRTQPSTDVVLQGPVGQAGDPLATILGINIDTSGFLDDQFKGLNDLPIGRAAFFDPTSGAAAGRLVKARGMLLGNVVSWNQIELED